MIMLIKKWKKGVYQGIKYDFDFPSEDIVDNDNDTEREIKVITLDKYGKATTA